MVAIAERTTRATLMPLMAMLAMGAGTLPGCVDGRSFTVGEQQAFVLDVPPGTNLVISSPYGDIDVAPSGEELPDWVGRDGGTGTITATDQQTVVIAWLRSSSQERLEQVQFRPVLSEGSLVLASSWPTKSGDSKDAVYFVIRTPHALGSVTATTGYGDVEIEQRHASATIKTGYGDVDLKKSAGSVTIDTGYGDVELDEVSGPVTVKTGYGDVEIDLPRDHTGSLVVNSGYGDIEIDSKAAATGTLTLRTGRGTINATTPRGTVVGQRGSSVIDGDANAPNWSIRTGYGDIEIKITGD